MATAIVAATRQADTCEWLAIIDPAVRIIIDPNGPPILSLANDLLDAAPFAYRISRPPDQLLAQLPALPDTLRHHCPC